MAMQVNLADACLVLTASVSPPPVPRVDFAVADPGTGPQITSWNAARLGPQPSEAQLEAVTLAQVSAYYAGQALAGVPSLLTQIESLPLAVRLGDLYVAQELNAIIAWLNGTLLPALKAAGVTVPDYAIPADVTAVGPSPLTVQDGLTQAGNVLTKEPGWLTITG
jgi:hypothetical protein